MLHSYLLSLFTVGNVIGKVMVVVLISVLFICVGYAFWKYLIAETYNKKDTGK